jgi:DNA-binding LacI/PurR family transcriptional regulator
LLKGIEGTLAEAGCRLMFCRTGDSPERERELIREMVQRGAIGLIVYPAEGESYSEEILRLTLDGYPIVVIDRYLKGLETNCVCSDHRSGAHAATAHLLRHGHKRIAFVTTPIAGTSSLEDRLEGYKQALAEAMLPFDQRLVLTELHERRLAQFFRVNRDITAAFAVNAGIGLRVIDAVEAAGLRVPEDVSVAFFDTYDYASHARIPPTCVVQQEEEIGRQAAELLLAVIRNPGRERRQIVLKPVLVEGRSTGPAPRHGGSSEEPAPA